MSFGDHLDELRRRVFLSLVVPIPVMIIAFFFSDTLLRLLLLPLFHALKSQGLPTALVELAPPEILMTKLKISVITSIVLSGPWIVWQLWLFIKPGLYRQEQRFVYFLMPGSVVFTLGGVALMYFIMLPMMLQFMIGFGQDLNWKDQEPEYPAEVITILESTEQVPFRYQDPETPANGDVWLAWPDFKVFVAYTDADGAIAVFEVRQQNEYRVTQSYQISKTVSFILLLFLAIAIAFQLPLVLLLLGWMDLVTPKWLRQQRRYAVLVTGLVCAIITPPDIMSMVMMMVPIYGLYELGILMIEYIPASRVSAGLFGSERQDVKDAARSENDSGHSADADKQTNSSEQMPKPVQSESAIPRTRPDVNDDEESDQSSADDPGAGT